MGLTVQPNISSKIPMWVKLFFTAYVALHFYINFQISGVWNVLWFCDIAVLVTLTAMWTESRLLASVAAVAMLIPMGLWIVDLAWRLALGHGHYLFGFAGYMFDRQKPWYVRFISTFHVWMPALLVWLLLKLGYDRRALVVQTVFATVLLLLCRMISPLPSDLAYTERNINWVYGTSDTTVQTAIPGWLYLGLMIVSYPLVVYLPTHLVLCYVFDRKPANQKVSQATETTCLT